MLTVAKDVGWSPPTKEGEHTSSSIVFVSVPPLLDFVVDIILHLFPLFLQREIFRPTETFL